MLVHVAGGREEPRADVALVWPRGLRVGAGAASVHSDAVNRLEVHVEVAGLGVAAAAQPALVRPLVGVGPHVSLQQGRHVELLGTSGALQGQREGYGGCGGRGRRHSWGGGGGVP